MGDAGDEIRSWYAEVVAKNYRLFYTIAYGVLHDAHAADDATQEAMLRAFEKIAALTEPAGVVPWLAQITRNVSLDIRKKGGKRKVRGLGDQTMDRIPGAAAKEPRATERRMILDEINRLPAPQALVVTLRYLEDLSIDEIAIRLGITPNTARVRLHRALTALGEKPFIRRLGEEAS